MLVRVRQADAGDASGAFRRCGGAGDVRLRCRRLQQLVVTKVQHVRLRAKPHFECRSV